MVPKQYGGTIAAITIVTCLFAFFIGCLVWKMKVKNRRLNAFPSNDENSQGEDQLLPNNTHNSIENRYFSIDDTSSSENYDIDEDDSVRTPIIRPRRHP